MEIQDEEVVMGRISIAILLLCLVATSVFAVPNYGSCTLGSFDIEDSECVNRSCGGVPFCRPVTGTCFFGWVPHFTSNQVDWGANQCRATAVPWQACTFTSGPPNTKVCITSIFYGDLFCTVPVCYVSGAPVTQCDGTAICTPPLPPAG